jgi:hypothetical protein
MKVMQQIYAWVDDIPLTRPKRNITRDFSDGGVISPTLNTLHPTHLAIHTYLPSLTTRTKLTKFSLKNLAKKLKTLTILTKLKLSLN